MITFLKNFFSFEDDRGYIKGLVNVEKWEEINIINSKSNIIRGSHYHKCTKELFIILDGKIDIFLQNVKNGNLVGEISTYKVKKGDVFIINENVNHSFKILKDSTWINALTKKMDAKKPDILKTKATQNEFEK